MSQAYIRAKSKRRKRPVVIPFSAFLTALAAFLVLSGLVVWLIVRHVVASRTDPMAGYISDVAELEKEYAAAHGRLLENADARQMFGRAAELFRKGEFTQAAGLLEADSKLAAVPVVFNDLGVTYARLEDRSRTVNAFREALARDPKYRPVLQNLVNLRNITEDEARPVTREIEPNSTNSTANVIAVGSQVEGEIAAGVNDIDVFKFPAPPAPRDMLVLEINAGSPDLALGWSLYDDSVNQIGRVGEQPKPGESVHLSFAPQPNTSFFLSVWGMNATHGPYVISLKALRAYDAYEPNDDIFHAHEIHLAETITANILDGQDQDFFWFQPDRSGTADIALGNSTPTLVPGLTVFGPDQRTIGFAPNAQGPGASLQYSVPVEGGQRYYIQVWPVLERSSGDYTLRVELH
jgi:hypothetical protein